MFQTGKNVKVNYYTEGASFGVKPAAGTALQFRTSPSSGLELKKATVSPTEFRSDGMTTVSRHGSRSVEGEYAADLSIGTFDALLEAALRGTWVASFTITEAAMTSITTTASTIVAAGGSWITQGVRKGMIVRLTNHSTGANNNKNLRVLNVTASTITVPTGDLVLDAAPDAAFTLTVLKSLIMANPPTNRSFTFEQVMQDLDKTEVFKGCRITGVSFRFQPDATVQVTFRLMGQDMEVLEGASAPYFTNPTITTTVPLVVVDGELRLNGVDSAEFTSFEVNVDLGGAVQAVLGSNLTPDVFLNNAKITANVSMLREDMDNLNLFLNETSFEIHVYCVEPDSEPKDVINFFFGQCKMMSNTKSLGADNALIETAQVDIAKDEAGSGNAATMMLISTSAA